MPSTFVSKENFVENDDWLEGPAGAADDPKITGVTPTGLTVASPSTLMTVTGTEFISGSVIEIAQQARATTFVNATTLTCQWDPQVAATVNFTVRNPNQEESNSWPYTVGALAAADVSGMSIDEVKDYVRNNPDQLSEVAQFERNGQNRPELVAWLQALLDEE
jgi:hypothetical protein